METGFILSVISGVLGLGVIDLLIYEVKLQMKRVENAVLSHTRK